MTILSRADHSLAIVVVAAIVVLFAVVVLGLSLLLLVHHLRTDRRRRLLQARILEAAELLAPALVGDAPPQEFVHRAVDLCGRAAVATVLRRSRVLLDGPAQERATRYLEEIGEIDRQCGQALRVSPWRRVQALEALGEVGGLKAHRMLRANLDDDDFEVRRAAQMSLLVHGSPDSVEIAVRAFTATTPLRIAWRKSFLAQLAAVSGARLVELVAEGGLQSDDEKLAIDALANARVPGSVEIAVRGLDSPIAEHRAASARLLGKLRSTESVGPLLDLLDDPEWFVRATAARALASLDARDQACGALRRRLNDSSWWVRNNAAYSLAVLGEEGVRALRSALVEPDRYSRDAALAALSTLAPEVEKPTPAVVLSSVRAGLQRSAEQLNNALRSLERSDPSHPEAGA